MGTGGLSTGNPAAALCNGCLCIIRPLATPRAESIQRHEFNIKSGIEQAATLIMAEALVFEALVTVLGFPTPAGYQPASQNERSNLSTHRVRERAE